MTDPVIFSAPPLLLDARDERAWLDERPLKLSQKPFRLLHTLMSAPQQLLTKDDLIETVWEGRAVSDAVLTTAMRDLRKALDDDARAPVFVETVHGRGYRFLKPVETANGVDTDTPHRSVPEPDSSPSARRLQWAAFAVILLVALGVFLWRSGSLATVDPESVASEVTETSIAVLPFVDLSPDGDKAYFSQGLSEEILNVLAGVEELRVVSRTSSFALAPEDATIAEIGDILGVRYILEGSVREASGRLRITAQLIDAESDLHLWSQTYERDLTVENIFAIQDEIAEAIVTALETKMGDALGEQRAATASAAAGTKSLEAYDAYLRARELFIAREDLPQSLTLARTSVAADPEFARGWELLAATAFVQDGDPTAEAQNAAARALALDPDLSLAHALRGIMSNINPPHDWAGAIADLERAIELDPKNTTALLWLGVELRKLGFLDRAQRMFERCLEIDPAYHRCRVHLMWTLHMNGQTDRAIAEYRNLVERGAPPDDTVLLFAAIERGDSDLETVIENSLSSQDPLPDIVIRALRDKSADQEQAGNALAAWLDTQSFNRRDVFPVIQALKRYDLIAPTQGSFLGFWLPEFPEYRQSGHFRNYVRAMHIDAYWHAHGFPPQCKAAGENDFACT